MLQLPQEGIQRALIHSQQIPADLLNPPGNPHSCRAPSTSGVLNTINASVPSDTAGFSLIASLTLSFPTGIDHVTTPLGKREEISNFLCDARSTQRNKAHEFLARGQVNSP